MSSQLDHHHSEESDWGRLQYAHRIAHALGKGDVPEGAHVLHKCDVPLCCNPAHLFLGDHAANMRDRYARGRVRVPKAQAILEEAAALRGFYGGGEK